jgi:ribosomal protein S18 acetylase RimI-like enzyme
MSVVVRALEPADWELLRGVRLAALLDSPGAFYSTYAETVIKPEPYWRAWPRDGVGLMAFLDGTPVGLVGVASNPAGYADLFAMWVAPEARGSGAADALIEAALAWAAAADLAEVRLEVAPGNERAARVYARHGFLGTDEPATCAGGRTFRVVTPKTGSSRVG